MSEAMPRGNSEILVRHSSEDSEFARTERPGVDGVGLRKRA